MKVNGIGEAKFDLIKDYISYDKNLSDIIKPI